MNKLIPVINEIIKYGLQPNLTVVDRDTLLEKNLIKIYSLYFEIQYVFDGKKYLQFDRTKYPKIIQNIQSNFKEFGFYKIIIDINDIDNKNSGMGLGDAVDDLADIILDLLEVKWRIENNSLNDGLWFFEFIFLNHMQQHILDLLNYMKQKEQ
jgi:hypothetical protein